MDITLTINGRDFSERVSNYNVRKEVQYARTVTTISNRELYFGRTVRDVVEFSLIPFSDSTALADYNALTATPMLVSYSDPNYNGVVKRNVEMVLVSDLEAVYGLLSVDGNHYHKGTTIQLRAVNL